MLARDTLRANDAIRQAAHSYSQQTGLPCMVIPAKASSGRMRLHTPMRARGFSTMAHAKMPVAPAATPVAAAPSGVGVPEATFRPRVLLVNHGYPPQFNGECKHSTAHASECTDLELNGL